MAKYTQNTITVKTYVQPRINFFKDDVHRDIESKNIIVI